jgi:hypothetical protein
MSWVVITDNPYYPSVLVVATANEACKVYDAIKETRDYRDDNEYAYAVEITHIPGTKLKTQDWEHVTVEGVTYL